MSNRDPGKLLKNERRKVLIFEMVTSGATYRQVREALTRSVEYDTLSEGRISKIVRAELDKLAEQRVGLAERMFDLKLEQLNGVIRSNSAIVFAKCRRCKGTGEYGEDLDKAPGTPAICEKCKGNAFEYGARDRATASKEVRQAIDQQCKMLGLYAPEKFALTDKEGNDLDFIEELQALGADELEQELQSFLRATDQARLEKKHNAEHAQDQGAEGRADVK